MTYFTKQRIKLVIVYFRKIILQRLKQDNQSKAEVHLSSNKQNTSEKRNVLKQRHHSMASGDIPMIDGYLQPERYYSTVSEHRMIKGERLYYLLLILRRFILMS